MKKITPQNSFTITNNHSYSKKIAKNKFSLPYKTNTKEAAFTLYLQEDDAKSPWWSTSLKHHISQPTCINKQTSLEKNELDTFLKILSKDDRHLIVRFS